jgi:hypothetical protein
MSKVQKSAVRRAAPAHAVPPTAAARKSQVASRSRRPSDAANGAARAPGGVASAARLAANRANARRSTGPRTPAGKARGSANAVTHGLFCRRLLVHGASLQERPEEHDSLHQGWRDALRPCGRFESDLVEMICTGLWRRRRMEEMEGVYLELLERARGLAGMETWMRGAASRQGAMASIGREVRGWLRELERAQTRRQSQAPCWVASLPDPRAEDSGARDSAAADARRSALAAQSAAYARAEPAGFVQAPEPPGKRAAAETPETPEERDARKNRADPQPAGYKWAGGRLVHISERPEAWSAEERARIPVPPRVWPDDQPFPRKFRYPTPYPGQPEPVWPPGSPEALRQAAQRAQAAGRPPGARSGPSEPALPGSPPAESGPAATSASPHADEAEPQANAPEDSNVMITLRALAEPDPL